MGSINSRIALVVEHSGLSKTAFAKQINVSQQYVSKLIVEGTPSERTICDICRVYGVSRLWLETGEGEMFSPTSLDEELAGLMGKLLSDESESFRKRFLSVLLRFGDDEWGLLEKLTQEMTEIVSQMKKDTEP